MRLVVVSHKPCWTSSNSSSGYATDGGFPLQMQALSELFDTTVLLVPCSTLEFTSGVMPLIGHNLSVVPLTMPGGADFWRKTRLLLWLIRNGAIVAKEILRADAVHTPIPGDIGTLGMLLAFVLNKPLFVRHCGNWSRQRTAAEHFWRWFMERFAGGQRVMLATGGMSQPPSLRNPAINWIFATSLCEEELLTCATYRQYLPGQEPKLIIACRQEKDKGTDLVIKSLPLIQQDFPGVTLDVVGDGEALTEFKKLAANLSLSKQVIFHGKVEHKAVIRLLQQADLLCYPTAASEGFPKVVHEALACGLPVVTTPVSVLPQLMGGGGGLLLEETTPTALAQAVRMCLTDTERYLLMSSKAIETAKQYSLERWRDVIGGCLQAAWGPLRSYG